MSKLDIHFKSGKSIQVNCDKKIYTDLLGKLDSDNTIFETFVHNKQIITVNLQHVNFMVFQEVNE